MIIYLLMKPTKCISYYTLRITFGGVLIIYQDKAFFVDKSIISKISSYNHNIHNIKGNVTGY